jgi:hypothetical protein
VVVVTVENDKGGGEQETEQETSGACQDLDVLTMMLLHLILLIFESRLIRGFECLCIELEAV